MRLMGRYPSDITMDHRWVVRMQVMKTQRDIGALEVTQWVQSGKSLDIVD